MRVDGVRGGGCMSGHVFISDAALWCGARGCVLSVTRVRTWLRVIRAVGDGVLACVLRVAFCFGSWLLSLLSVRPSRPRAETTVRSRLSVLGDKLTQLEHTVQ